tara:strand:- start:18369 stop:18986 length:618 start_codon:yes stop_codon:yes gene_type:complete
MPAPNRGVSDLVMSEEVAIPFIGSSVWEDLAEGWQILAAILLAYFGLLNLFEYKEIDGWIGAFCAVSGIFYLAYVAHRRRRYKNAVMIFSEYPPERGKAFSCKIIFDEEFELKGTGLAEIHRSGFDGAGRNDHYPLWSRGAVLSHCIENGKTVLSFNFTIEKTLDTSFYYTPCYRDHFPKWKLVLNAKRKDRKRFPRRRYIEVWE